MKQQDPLNQIFTIKVFDVINIINKHIRKAKRKGYGGMTFEDIEKLKEDLEKQKAADKK